MLSFHAPGARTCDGLARRDFLRLGAASGMAFGLGSLTLADVLRAEGAGTASGKSIINIHLNGGPSHLDMFDMKPNAPIEIRGEFSPTATNVPGIEICDLMPQLAKLADKFAIVRSITGLRDEHTPNQSESGFSAQDLRNVGGRPSVGSVVAKLHGATAAGDVPRFVDLAGFSHPGFLGSIYSGFRPDGNGRDNLKTRSDLPAERLNDRASLLSDLDRLRRDMDRTRSMDAMDSFQQRAVGVVLSGRMAAALNWESESNEVKERYGLLQQNNGEQKRYLLARRMIEVGARVVSLGFTGWDTHGNNFIELRKKLPLFDTGLAALISDLDERGLLSNTIIMVTGEFGRTPRVNSGAGRDHWSKAAFAFLAGGGLRTGQILGSTDRYGEAPADRPVHIGEVFATLYQAMGINPRTTTLIDPNGRPQYLTQKVDPLPELLG